LGQRVEPDRGTPRSAGSAGRRGASPAPKATHRDAANLDEGLARAGAADQQAMPLLGGEPSLGLALFCSEALPLRLTPPL
jgi:hypothetical protein